MNEPTMVCVGTEANVLKKPCKSTGFNQKNSSKLSFGVSSYSLPLEGGGLGYLAACCGVSSFLKYVTASY